MNQMQESRGRAPKKLGAVIDEIARKANATKRYQKQLEIFLNEELDDNEHIVEQVKAIIDMFPESLSQVDGFGNLPIQNAVLSGGNYDARVSVSFVPLIAREGCRLGVGGEGNRGGLLSADENGLIVIQYLTIGNPKGFAFNEFDRKRVKGSRGASQSKPVDKRWH